MTDWPDMPIRRACINSFGYGGANAHCILDHKDSVISDYISRRSSTDHGSELPSKTTLNNDPTNLGIRSKGDFLGSVIVNGGSAISSDRNLIENINGSKGGVTDGGLVYRNANGLTNHMNGTNGNTDNIQAENDNDFHHTKELRRSSSEVYLKMKEALLHRQSNIPGLTSNFVEVADGRTRRLVLLPFSAHDEYSLQANIMAIGTGLGKQKLSDLAYTLASRRSKFFYRGFIVADSDTTTPELNIKSLTFGKCPNSQARVGFVFTGQGAQWAEMGAALFSEYAVFRSSIQYQDAILAKLSIRPNWTIGDMLLMPAANSRIQEPEFSQTLCTALQIALVDLLHSWNVQPVATVGHSSGEIAAAYAAGAHSAAESIVMAYLRGQVVSSSNREGSMLAVGLSAEAVVPYIQGAEGEIKIAAINSPQSVTLSGDKAAVTACQGKLEEDKVFARILKTGGKAYHSHHMADLGDLYQHLAGQCLTEIAHEIAAEPKNQSDIFWQSSVTPYKNNLECIADPIYWRRNLESPVLFSQAVQALVENEVLNLDLLVEVGPHPTLGGPLKQIRSLLEQENRPSLPVCLASLKRGEDSLKSMFVLCGHLFMHNTSIDLAAVNALDDFNGTELRLAHGSLCIDMVTYQYHYGPVLYHENRYNRELRLRKHLRHDILGARQPCNSSGHPAWRNVLRLKDIPWLEDHKVCQDFLVPYTSTYFILQLIPHAVFPAAGYIAMAVEAISQLHYEASDAPAIAGYSLRSVAINSALQVPSGDIGIETILNMHLIPLTGSKFPSKWVEFTISSALPESDSWIEHCSGRISIETTYKDLVSLNAGHMNLHDIETEPWYRRFEGYGLGYGPAFRGVSNLKVSERKNLATADIDLRPITSIPTDTESRYPLHPAAFDTCLQLGLIACHGGDVENLKHIYVPTAIDSLSIWIPDGADEKSDVAHGVATGEFRGLRGVYGEIQLFSISGLPLLHVEKLRCTLYDGSWNKSSAVSYPRDPYHRVSWKPDITLLSNDQVSDMFPSMIPLKTIGPVFAQGNRLATYLIIQLSELQKNIVHPDIADHLQKFLDWIERRVEAARAGKLESGLQALAESPDQRSQMIEQLCDEMNDIIEIKLVKRIYDHMPAILTNAISPLQVALQDDLLTEVYKSGIVLSSAYPQFTRILDLLAHKKPRMRILEIGAGTGGATRYALKILAGTTSSKRYKDYTFTDITTTFLSPAQTEFSHCKGMIYKKLDISIDPFEQGFQQDYDLVIASQCLHTTTTMAKTIRNVRKLLKLGGSLVMLESTQALDFVGLVFGTFPDYWNGVKDGRIDSPFLDRKNWNEVLLSNGFSGTDIVVDDLPQPVSLVSTIVSKAVETTISSQILRPLQSTCIYIVYLKEIPSLANNIASLLQKTGVDSLCVSLSDAHCLDCLRVISLIESCHSPLQSSSQSDFESARALICRASSLVWVSAGGLLRGSRPTAALIHGVMTTVAVERPSVRFVTVDLEPLFDPNATDTAQKIVDLEYSLQQNAEDGPRDTEYIMDKGCLHISRIMPDHHLNHRFKLQERLIKDTTILPIRSQAPLRIDFEQPGLLNSMYFRADDEYLQPLPDHQVELKTTAIGLNLRVRINLYHGNVLY